MGVLFQVGGSEIGSSITLFLLSFALLFFFFLPLSLVYWVKVPLVLSFNVILLIKKKVGLYVTLNFLLQFIFIY